MSRVLKSVAPLLKVLIVVVIIAAWVEANAKRVYPDAAPPSARSLSKSSTSNSAPNAGDCSPRFDRRNVQQIAPARPRVIEA